MRAGMEWNGTEDSALVSKGNPRGRGREFVNELESIGGIDFIVECFHARGTLLHT